MRHRIRSVTLSRASAGQRMALVRSLVRSLIDKERIITTEARAKEARILTDKLMRLAKEGSLHARRLAISRLHDRKSVGKLFDDIAKRNPSRAGGHTRMLRLDERRLGDGVRKVLFELVDRKEEVKETKAPEVKDEKAKKAPAAEGKAKASAKPKTPKATKEGKAKKEKKPGAAKDKKTAGAAQ